MLLNLRNIWNTSTLSFFLSSFLILSSFYLFAVGVEGYCCTWSHLDTPHSIGLLWTKDRPVAVTSTWQQTTPTTDRHPCTRWDSNPQSQQASGHWTTLQTARPLGPARYTDDVVCKAYLMSKQVAHTLTASQLFRPRWYLAQRVGFH
jgi:hypothetical protein